MYKALVICLPTSFNTRDTPMEINNEYSRSSKRRDFEYCKIGSWYVCSNTTQRDTTMNTGINQRRGRIKLNRNVDTNNVDYCRQREKLGKNTFTLFIININYCNLYIINKKSDAVFI